MSKVKLIECLRKLAKENGFTLAEFVKYKASLTKEKCFNGYSTVYPEHPIISKTGDKTYVDNLDIMLSDNLYKGGTIIKLQDKYIKDLGINQPPDGWYVSEKWDGIRAVWDGEKFISRGSGSGKPKVYTYVPEWFKMCMPPGVALDGEVWMGRNLFQKISGISNYVIGGKYTRKQLDLLWAGQLGTPPIIFKAFDLPGSTLPFEQRMSQLKLIIDDRYLCWKKYIEYPGKNVFPIEFTNQILVNNNDELQRIFGNLISKGAEGIILRAPKSLYQAGKRSKYSLKYKIKEDAECVVLRYNIGEGRLKGLLGSLECELIKNGKLSGIISNVGTGFSDIQRTEYNDPKSKEYIPIGSIVSFSYMEMTKEGIPRHPVYRGVRHDISIPTQGEVVNVNKDTVIKILKRLILKIQTDRQENWAFKRKRYTQIIEILEVNTSDLKTINDYILTFRNGGMKLEGEEVYFKKTGQWKSGVLEKIDEILITGTLREVGHDPKVDAVEQLIKIPGIGEASAIKLYDTYSIKSIPELIELYKINPKAINDKQAIGLKYYAELQERIPRSEMTKWNETFKILFKQVIDSMKQTPENAAIELVGSYRRGKETSGDVDVLITSDTLGGKLMIKFTEALITSGIITKDTILSSGPTKLMAIGGILGTNRHIDVFYFPKDIYPFSILFLTGSGPFNQEMRLLAAKQGYSLNERNFRKVSPSSGVLKA